MLVESTKIIVTINGVINNGISIKQTQSDSLEQFIATLYLPTVYQKVVFFDSFSLFLIELSSCVRSCALTSSHSSVIGC